MVEELKQREAMNPNYQWNLTAMYPSDQAFEEDLKEVRNSLKEISKYQGHLAEGPGQLAEALDLYLDLQRRLSYVYVYSHLKNDQDQTNNQYQDMEARASQLLTEFGEETAFFAPELMAIPEEKLEDFIKGHDRLAFYRQYLDNETRFRDHTLSDDQERLLAQGQEVFGNAVKSFSVLNNADLKFPQVHNQAGDLVTLSHGNFINFLESSNRKVRQEAFEAHYSIYDQFKNTFASLLSGQIKSHNYLAKARHFDSARQAALFSDHVPEEVYDTLIETVNGALEGLHQYMALRKEQVGLDQLEAYDLYTPILGEPSLTFTYEEAKKITLEALAPLGEKYGEILQAAFDGKWIDVYENVGKRSGAYSSGAYGSNPYILMNWQDGLNSLYTLVHELGHSLHTYMTNHEQDYVYSHYSIFLAEIASTTNENLLTQYLLDHYSEPSVRAYVLNHFLDGVKGTIYRQTQFAEFEHFMHEQDAKGQPLTADFLSDHYEKLNAKYYGESVNSNSPIRLEWSRIPHFYYNYYVFQYATGFSAAVYFSQAILSGDPSKIEAYLNFLKSGNKAYPLDTMLEAGLDMTKSDYIQASLDLFKERLAEFKELI